MQDDIDRILFDRDAIDRRLDELAATIITDLHGAGDITLIPVLTGSIIFVADLMRRLPVKMKTRLMSVTSYPGQATESQGATLHRELTNVPNSLAGQHVLVIDDILDSGSTLKLVTDELRQRNPEDLRTCVLLRKQRPDAMNFPVDYVAFDIPDEFVIGYGLDYDGYYRNLPQIATLKQEVINAAK